MAQKIKSLLKEFNPKTIKKVKKLNLSGVGKADVYNITAPFKVGRKSYLLGRVEPRNKETGTVSMFFKKTSRKWQVDPECPIYTLQDPFIFKLKEQIIIGGIETKEKPKTKLIGYRTVFYKGKDIKNLKKIVTGPWGMKGIRFVQLGSHKIGVFTRPQGKKGRRGKIGFTTTESLNKLKPRKLSRTPVIDEMFARGEWGGVDEVFLLKNKKLGILGHAAHYSKNWTRHYYPITFIFDPETKEFYDLKIIARKADFPHGECKRPDLRDVVYPGGLTRDKKTGLAKLYAGVSDAEAYEITIEDPFLEYEKEFKEEMEIEESLNVEEQDTGTNSN